ncbi:hypothetical protein [Ottowia sp. VDI28]|uniref:hypothetical protein n=1 Tax=Ottowia sp. VDI28 TaxID=3133968 RepID=UPI003C2ED9D6
MQAKNIALAPVLAAVFAGNAFAAQPVSGEGPLFQNEVAAVSTVSRAEVIKQAIANPPAAGVNTAVAYKADAPSNVSRAEVRKQTRDAIAAGYQIKSGEMS